MFVLTKNNNDMKTNELIIKQHLAELGDDFTQEEIADLVISLQKDYENEKDDLAQCPCCDSVFKINDIEDTITRYGGYDNPDEYDYICPKCDRNMGDSIIEPDLLSYLEYTS